MPSPGLDVITSDETESLDRPESKATATSSHTADHTEKTVVQNNVRSLGDDANSTDHLERHLTLGLEHQGEYQIVKLTGPDDPTSPLNRTPLQKWLIVTVVAAASLNVTCSSSLATSTFPQIEEEFGISREVATLTLSLFVIGVSLSPLFLGPFSELYGRRPVYIISYFLYLVWTVPAAIAQNIATLLIARFFQGLCGAAFLSVAGGTVADLFLPKDVSAAMNLFTLGPFLGPSLGPILSGFINQHANWRWTYYVALIWTGVQFIVLLMVPETYAPALLKHRAQKLRKRTGNQRIRAQAELDHENLLSDIRKSCITPFEIILREPMALLLDIWTSVVLGILYSFFASFSIVFGQYGFNQQETGLSFLGIAIGMIGATASQPIWTRYNYRVITKMGHLPPEAHLVKAQAGAVIMTIGLFWFAFTCRPPVHWSVCIIATIPFGVGTILLFSSIFTYLVAAYRPFAASAMSGNTWMRSSFAASFPLFTVQLYDRLGVRWASALCAFLSLALSPLPFVFHRIGGRLRQQSKFSGTQ